MSGSGPSKHSTRYFCLECLPVLSTPLSRPFRARHRLRDLTEAQIERNQYATDVELERLDGEADHAAERIGGLEDRMADSERGLNALLELGREQTEASTRAARGLGQLATCVLAQQNKIRAMEERMDAMREMILGLEHGREPYRG